MHASSTCESSNIHHSVDYSRSRTLELLSNSRTTLELSNYYPQRHEAYSFAIKHLYCTYVLYKNQNKHKYCLHLECYRKSFHTFVIGVLVICQFYIMNENTLVGKLIMSRAWWCSFTDHELLIQIRGSCVETNEPFLYRLTRGYNMSPKV